MCDYWLLTHSVTSQVQDHMYLVTGDIKYRSNPLIGAPDTMVSVDQSEASIITFDQSEASFNTIDQSGES